MPPPASAGAGRPPDLPVVCLHGLGGPGEGGGGARPALSRVGSGVPPPVPGGGEALAAADSPGPGLVVVGHPWGGAAAIGLAGSADVAGRAAVVTGCFCPPARNGRST